MHDNSKRLDGLDLARFLAFVGMVIVNFSIVMGAKTGSDVLSILITALEGRAAATFVVLAGVGLGLASLKGVDHTATATIKRAIFLLALGLINTLIFDADIIHYYAFYFLFGALLLRFGNHLLITTIVFLNLVFVILISTLNYDQNWNWENYSYADFWTSAGFVRNLFFNGWHPVFPWLGFLLYGIILGRMTLAKWTTQRNLIVAGLVLFAFAETVSAVITPPLTAIDQELAALVSTQPIPPMPLYTVAGVGVASAVIGVCLAIADWATKVGILRLIVPAGKQTLTLYFAHIYVGMGVLESLDMLEDQSLPTAFASALLFCTVAVIYALLWSKKFKRGPVEVLMRRISG